MRWRDTNKSDRMTSSFDGPPLGTDVPIMRSGSLQDLPELTDFAGRNRGTAVAELTQLSVPKRSALRLLLSIDPTGEQQNEEGEHA